MRERLYLNSWNEHEIAEAKQLLGPILILGASGFIGANLFFSLNELRDDVFGCSRYIQNSRRFQNNHSKNLESVDLTDYQELEKLIKKIRPRTIFNLSGHGSYHNDIEKVHLTNYFGTLNILRAVETLGDSVLVQTGSSSEYGLNCTAPSETAELMPNSHYSVSKIGSSYLVKYYGKVIRVPVIQLRLYSIYGPWEDERRLTSVLISHCQKGNWPNLTDPNNSRDFVYIDDCTNALIKSALTLKSGRGFGEIINIATGIKTSLEDLTKLVAELFNIKEKPQFMTTPTGKWDLENWYGNPELAFKLLGWRHRTSLKDGLRLLFEWGREFKKTRPLN